MIELAKGKKQQLQCLGWKSGDDCRRRLFALDQNGKPLVVKLKPAMPDYYDPLRRAKAIFCGEPFPEAVCIEISPCLLLPPPCYQSRAEFETQRDGHFFVEPWRWIYAQAHNQILILEPSDDKPLQERLDKWLAAMRAACEREASMLRDRLKQVKTATLKQLGVKTEKHRAKKLREMQAQLDMVESETAIDGILCKGRLKMTLDDVKQGYEGIRDAWMQEDWAHKNGEDLSAMYRHRQVFCRWLEMRTGTRAKVFDMTTRERRLEIAPPEFGNKFENNPQFLEACAQVRYRARFADNANTVVYLADCEVREELTSAELDEVAKLKPAVTTAQAVDSINLRPSSNYRQLFWTDQGTEQQANLTKTQANAFSALHHAHGFILARDEWQEAIYGDEPTNDFRPDKIFRHKDGRKVWDRFIRVDGDRYRLVIKGE